MRIAIKSFNLKDVYIIIVTYNALPWLKKCLESCRNYNVIVVDNASTDETLQFISENHIHVNVLPQKENLGFGKANNIGISYALKNFSADYVFLLNQDAYLVDSVIEDLINTHKEHSNYGILSPIHITGDKKRLDKKFAEYLEVNNDEEFNSEDILKSGLRTIYEVPFVNAAGWLISKDCLINVGGFDPMFFLYGEDDNLCQRILYHGYKIGIVSSTFMIHDRAERNSDIIDYTSEKHLKIQSNIYKVKYGNVNNLEVILAMRNKVKYLKRQYLKCLFSLKLKDANIAYKKCQLLVSSKKEIELSYYLNKTKAPHYLSI